ncbi:MAG: hypothetical protein AAGK97_16420, partial [Bacteroidota bacterium]
LIDGQLIATKTINETLNSNAERIVEFDDPFSFSELKNREIKLFVKSEGDVNPLNDTTTATVYRFAELDLALKQIEFDNNCGPLDELIIEIENRGSVEVTNAELNLFINDQFEDQIIWEGSLMPFEKENVSVTILNNAYGQDLVKVQIEKVNEAEDQLVENNEIVETIEITPTVEFELTTDDFPGETSWQLRRDRDGAIVASGNGTARNLTTNTLIDLQVDECYTFTIFDSSDDGICCRFGEGSYELVNDHCTVLVQGGMFEAQESTSFCVSQNTDCNIIVENDIQDEASSGARDGMINVNVSNVDGPVLYSIDRLETTNLSGSFSNLEAGEYQVWVIYNNGNCAYKETVTVGLLTNTINLNNSNAELIIRPNPNNGYFNVEVHNSNSQDLF